MKLNQLKIGEKATVKELKPNSNLRKRLMELGFLPGKEIECVLKSPLKDPTAYKICGAVIAIRNSDAEDITVTRRQS